MTRTNRDFYPTPPCAAMAIGEWLRARVDRMELHSGVMTSDPWLDPAAGFGTLLEWAGIPRECRQAKELGDELFLLHELTTRVPSVDAGVDALTTPWPGHSHILANPPFADLDAFARRTIEHHDRAILACEWNVCALFTPVGFWHTKNRLDIRAPQHVLPLTWRPDFLRADTGTFQDFVWAVWERPSSDDRNGTRWERLARPAVPQAVLDEHDRLARLAAGREPANQLALAMGAA